MRSILFSLSFASLFAAVTCGSSGPDGFLDQVFLAKACPTQAAGRSTTTGTTSNSSVAVDPANPATWPPNCLQRGALCGSYGGLLGECCPGLTCVWEGKVTDTAYCR
ncbi:hypothetical protein BS17DRAFT_777656 [Gyrodon lividus]|nr:hypothetical protein BS17DRAFT_777656 [Gyrodon lividus]